MKLIGTELGRVIIFFSPEEIRPDRGIPLRSSIELVQERYAFLKTPNLSDPIEKLNQEGYKFQEGTFLYEGAECPISDLTLLREGMVIIAKRTEYCESFLDDYLEWGKSAFGLKSFSPEPKKTFLSQVYVEFEKAANSMLNQNARVLGIIQRYICQQNDIESSISSNIFLKRIDFGFDPESIPGLRPANFLLERRVTVPYIQNRFFSEAPLKTEQHIELLEEIEGFLN